MKKILITTICLVLTTYTVNASAGKLSLAKMLLGGSKATKTAALARATTSFVSVNGVRSAMSAARTAAVTTHRANQKNRVNRVMGKFGIPAR